MVIFLNLILGSYLKVTLKDYNGNDFKYMESVAGDVTACEAECDKFDFCLGFSSHPKGNMTQPCWLKFMLAKKTYRDANSFNGSVYIRPNMEKVISRALTPILPGFIIDQGVGLNNSIVPIPYKPLTSLDLPYQVNKTYLLNGESIATCNTQSCYTVDMHGHLTDSYTMDNVVSKPEHFIATRTAISNHFHIVEATYYPFNGPFLSMKYTLAACMTECFHSNECKYVYFNPTSFQCALLQIINTTSLVYNYSTFNNDLILMAKNWTITTDFAVLPNFKLSGGTLFVQRTAGSCFKACNNACSFNYDTYECTGYGTTFINRTISPTIKNEILVINRKITGFNAILIPQLFIETSASPLLVNEALKLTKIVDEIHSCQTNNCNATILSKSSVTQNIPFNNKAVIAMDPSKLTIRNLRLWQNNNTILKEFKTNSIFALNTTMNYAFNESARYIGTAVFQVAIMSLFDCLKGCLDIARCVFASFDSGACTFASNYTISETVILGRDYIGYIKRDYVNYNISVDTGPSFDFYTSVNATTADKCLTFCIVDCYGVFYNPSTLECIMSSLPITNTTANVHFVHFSKVSVVVSLPSMKSTITDQTTEIKLVDIINTSTIQSKSHESPESSKIKSTQDTSQNAHYILPTEYIVTAEETTLVRQTRHVRLAQSTSEYVLEDSTVVEIQEESTQSTQNSFTTAIIKKQIVDTSESKIGDKTIFIIVVIVGILVSILIIAKIVGHFTKKKRVSLKRRTTINTVGSVGSTRDINKRTF